MNRGNGVDRLESQPEGITERIADFAVLTRYEDLPEAVRHEGRRALTNIVGCTLGGAHHEVVTLTQSALAPFAGLPQAALFGRGQKLDALNAALINCIASGIYAFDDTHEQAVVHPSGPVAAAAFALAEVRPVSGRAFALAFLLGTELVCRLSKAISVPPAKGSIAWAQTGVSAGIGAAVAAARLLELDRSQTIHAIGIALSQAAGFRAMFGTMCSSLMPAQAAATGLRAAFLAQKGFTSSTAAIEGRHGFLSVFAEQADGDALTAGLGLRFEMSRNTYKPYPCGIVIHPIVEACLVLRERYAIEPGMIASVQVNASPAALALTDLKKPQDGIQARVSLYHWVAIALLRGSARIADLDTETAVRDPTVMAFRERVQAERVESIGADSAEVIVTLQDGMAYAHRVDHCAGSALRPMSDAELEQKFCGQAEPVIGSTRARELLASCWNVDRLSDAAQIARAAG